MMNTNQKAPFMRDYIFSLVSIVLSLQYSKSTEAMSDSVTHSDWVHFVHPNTMRTTRGRWERCVYKTQISYTFSPVEKNFDGHMPRFVTGLDGSLYLFHTWTPYGSDYSLFRGFAFGEETKIVVMGDYICRGDVTPSDLPKLLKDLNLSPTITKEFI